MATLVFCRSGRVKRSGESLTPSPCLGSGSLWWWLPGTDYEFKKWGETEGVTVEVSPLNERIKEVLFSHILFAVSSVTVQLRLRDGAMGRGHPDGH